MKLSVLGIMLLIPLGYVAEQSATERRESQEGTTTATPFDLSAFATEVPIVEDALAKATGVSREDALAMYGRSSAASGRFDIAAAACAMFLNEFGTDHPYAEKIAVRFADCLFPFKYDQIDVIHTASGPRLEPAWRMGYSPRPEHLRQAVHAFDLAATLAQDEHAKGSALLKLGWVHRVLRTYPKTFFDEERITMHGIDTHGRATGLVGGTDSRCTEESAGRTACGGQAEGDAGYLLDPGQRGEVEGSSASLRFQEHGPSMVSNLGARRSL